MAPKRLPEDPPPASSSTEEEEESDEENTVSEDDDEKDKTPTTNKSTLTAADSSDASDSETESESNKSPPSPSPSDFTIKPVSAKPIGEFGKPNKTSANRKLAQPPSATATTGGKKRAGEGDLEGKKPKVSKLSNGQDVNSKKASGVGVPRLWSEDDEIALLKGVIEYRSKKGVDPGTEMDAFHGFIKKNFHADVSVSQLRSKIKRLKKKYQDLAKTSENGEEPVFSKPHENKFFELSKKIWGNVDDNTKNKKQPTKSVVKSSPSALPNSEVSVPPTNPKNKKQQTKSAIKSCPSPLPDSGITVAPASSDSSLFNVLLESGKLLVPPEGAVNVMKDVLPLIESSKSKELESKWRKLQEEEFELYMKRVELVHDYGKQVLAAMKSVKS